TFATSTVTIAASAGPNGTIAPSGNVAVNIGADQTFTFSPAACYGVADVVVDGTSLGVVPQVTFTSVTGPHTIAASFAANTPVITVIVGQHGAVAPTGQVPLTCGGNQTFTITPDAGYHVASVLIDGVGVGPVTSYAFTNVTNNHTLEATFAQGVLAV